MTDTVSVPRDLLDGLALPQHKRLVVAAWLLDPGGRFGREPFYVARDLWPELQLRRPGLLTVLSILLELEAKRWCEVVDDDGAFIEVRRERKAGAA